MKLHPQEVCYCLPPTGFTNTDHALTVCIHVAATKHPRHYNSMHSWWWYNSGQGNSILFIFMAVAIMQAEIDTLHSNT